MKTIGNVLWLVLAGFWLAVGYVMAALVMVVLIITIPFAVQSLKLAGYALWPFGRTVVERRGGGAASAVGNVVWLLFAGLWLAIGHLVTGVLLCVTIVGIPFGVANFKMVPLALMPFGKDVVRIGEVR